jgi:hypothetical protein
MNKIRLVIAPSVSGYNCSILLAPSPEAKIFDFTESSYLQDPFRLLDMACREHLSHHDDRQTPVAVEEPQQPRTIGSLDAIRWPMTQILWGGRPGAAPQIDEAVQVITSSFTPCHFDAHRNIGTRDFGARPRFLPNWRGTWPDAARRQMTDVPSLRLLPTTTEQAGVSSFIWAATTRARPSAYRRFLWRPDGCSPSRTHAAPLLLPELASPHGWLLHERQRGRRSRST